MRARRAVMRRSTGDCPGSGVGRQTAPTTARIKSGMRTAFVSGGELLRFRLDLRCLCIDEDHSIAATHAVERRLGGILEDLDGLDVARIEPGDAPIRTGSDRNTVQDEHRLAAAEERRGAVDADGDAAVGCTRHFEAGHRALERQFDRVPGSNLVLDPRDGRWTPLRRVRSVGRVAGNPGGIGELILTGGGVRVSASGGVKCESYDGYGTQSERRHTKQYTSHFGNPLTRWTPFDPGVIEVSR